MGLVFEQSVKNALIIMFGFIIGGINTLFLYTHFLEDKTYGLVVFLTSTGYLLMPLIIFGVHSAILKFYPTFDTQRERDGFLCFSLVIPLLVILPITALFISFYEQIISWISKGQPLIEQHGWLMLLMAVFAGYFEIFYAWTKIHLKSVFGNFIKELFARICVFLLLFAVYFELLNSQQFIYSVVLVYGLRVLAMFAYSLRIYRPSFVLKIPKKIGEILFFSLLIIVSGTSGSILLEIDKFMIPRYEVLEQVAYYGVAVFIATVVSIPNRAMRQISTSLTAIQMSKNKFKETGTLYRNSSEYLMLFGGLIFLLINVNIHDVYEIIDKPAYQIGIPVVLMISIAKLSDLQLSSGNDILQNSKYYRLYFFFAIAMALGVISLNYWLIPEIGIQGAALSTLLVMVFFNFLKIIFIHKKFKMSLSWLSNFKILTIILLIYGIFYFWRFDLNPYVSIFVKSFLILIMFIVAVKKTNYLLNINFPKIKSFKKSKS